MKALVYNAPETLGFQDMPEPPDRPGELLVEIDSAGICGSDMHAFLGHDERRPAPLILGHEASGTVISDGGHDFAKGTRVTINPLVTCGVCNFCRTGRSNLCINRQMTSMPPRHGAFANRLSIPPANLIALPDHLSFEQAALAEPIACGWHAVRLGVQALGDIEGPSALVIGGGTIGLGAALSLEAQGIDDITIIEPSAVRRDYLVDHVGCNIASTDDLADAAVFDLVIDAVGFAATRETASRHARSGGVIMHIGLGQNTGGLDIRRMTLQEITFIGTYTYTSEDFAATARAMFDGSLGALQWTESRSLADGQRAFEDIRAGRVAAPKIILKPN